MKTYFKVTNIVYSIIFFFVFTPIIFSQNLEAVFLEAASNKESLKDVLLHYKNSKEEQKYEAALFLIKNMSIHSSINYQLKDIDYKTIPFSEFDYKDFNVASKVFLKLKDSLNVKAVSFTRNDINVISSELLIKNIDLAFFEWKNNVWSKSYTFETFCEYILPYRSLIEPLEDWREDFQFLVREVKHNQKNNSNPVEVCTQVIYGLESFNFEKKRIDPIPLLSPQQLLFRREGACPDLANLALFASRSIGVAVTFDFTPHHGASSNRHFWNTVVDTKGNHIPFNGSYIDDENGLPYNYSVNNKRLGKVFRYTYSVQENTLASRVKNKDIPNGFLRKKNIKDVTHEYTNVGEINYSPLSDIKDNTSIAYLNVFNTRRWRETDWSEKNNGEFIFKNLGKDIVYLPSFYMGNKMTYAEHPILLDEKGNSVILKPDFTNTFETSLSRDNEYKNNYLDNNPFQIENGEMYKLFYWDKKWIKSGIGRANESGVFFKNIPKNALFLLLPVKQSGYERIFTIDSETGMIIWY
jgi:hypothetical protein